MKATTDSDKWDIVLSVLNDSQEVFYQDKRAAAALKYGKELRAAGGGLRELLDKRHNEWRDACDERDLALARAEAAEALAHERLEAALFAEQRATDAEALIRELTDAQTSELEPDSDWLAIVAAQRDRAVRAALLRRSRGDLRGAVEVSPSALNLPRTCATALQVPEEQFAYSRAAREVRPVRHCAGGIGAKRHRVASDAAPLKRCGEIARRV